jgi:hypothetical protein
MQRLPVLASILLLAAACTAPERPRPVQTSEAVPASARTRAREGQDASREAASAVVAPEPPALAPVTAVYPWGPTATDRLDGRFASPPAGFERVPAPAGSFAAFLRTLPLLPEGAAVVDFRGTPLHDGGHHPNIVAVVDLDVGNRDLQQCADSILRLHAEWRYGTGARDLTYRAVSGQTLSYARWLSGERSVVDGKNLVFRPLAAPAKDGHAIFRSWLDDVFSWAGTASIERDGKKVALADVRGGDFFVMSGSPFGHAVLVLDVATARDGRRALLLGQSYMPAQSFQVLRPAATGPAWFVVAPDQSEVQTPFWRPFPVGSLRRLG